MRTTNKMNKTNREDSDRELKMLAWRKCIKMHRIAEKFGARNKPRMTTKTMVQERNGLKVTHRINIFEKIAII